MKHILEEEVLLIINHADQSMRGFAEATSKDFITAFAFIIIAFPAVVLFIGLMLANFLGLM
ncbi:hypothetical protein [Leclercia sp.]|uniref:hypothetical protein n=1 Tax=Leclercia sp. TaxID=1898428 RepID=UPI0028B1CF08|nr:hypothetical protein [Leclercia sp.]